MATNELLSTTRNNWVQITLVLEINKKIFQQAFSVKECIVNAGMIFNSSIAWTHSSEEEHSAHNRTVGMSVFPGSTNYYKRIPIKKNKNFHKKGCTT